MKKGFIILGFIMVFAAVIRLVALNNVPNSITYDQIYYVLNAKSFLYTGTDLTGSVNPFQLLAFQYPTEGLVQAELPVFLQLPLLSFFGTTLAIVAFPNVLLSVLTIYVLFLIGAKLFDRRTGLWIAFIAAINPWFLFVGRTFYEVVPATFFFVLGFYVLLLAKRWWILLVYPIFLLAFYSYIGTKLIFFPFIMVAILYCYFAVHKRRYVKQYLVLGVLAFLTVAFFYFQLQQQPDSSRLDEIISFNHPAIVEQVDSMRKASIQHPFTSLIENKVTVFGKVIVTNFFNIVNPIYLFVQGDSFFSLYTHGLFYFIDAVFLIIGSVWLFIRNRKLFFFCLGAILIATLPQIIHDPEGKGNFTPHIALLIPFFIILIGLGIAQITAVKNSSVRRVLFVGIAFIYVFSIVNFLNSYFYQFPLRTGTFDFSTRVLSRYLEFAQNDNERIVVHTLDPEILFKKYLFYSNGYRRASAKFLNSSMREGLYAHDVVQFTSCPESSDFESTAGLVVVDANCGIVPEDDTLSIAQLSDSGSTFRIVHDRTCRNYSHNVFISDLKLDDLHVEKLGTEEFCRVFIIQ